MVILLLYCYKPGYLRGPHPIISIPLKPLYSPSPHDFSHSWLLLGVAFAPCDHFSELYLFGPQIPPLWTRSWFFLPRNDITFFWISPTFHLWLLNIFYFVLWLFMYISLFCYSTVNFSSLNKRLILVFICSFLLSLYFLPSSNSFFLSLLFSTLSLYIHFFFFLQSCLNSLNICWSPTVCRTP